jgi:hypothetical protein
MQGTGGVEVRRTALLSQEGSTIETAVEIVRGGGSRAALFKNAF